MKRKTGKLWIGTKFKGLNIFDPIKETFSRVDYLKKFDKNSVLNITIGENGILWVSLKYNGLLKINTRKREFTQFKHDPNDSSSIIDDTVWDIFEDESGIVWLATSSGLCSFDPSNNTFSKIGDFTNHREKVTLSLYKDTDNNIWFGTMGGGLKKYDIKTKKIVSYLEEDGLPNNTVYCVIGDNDGNIWVSTNNGIGKLDPKTEAFTNYDVNDGLQSNEFNSGAKFKSSSGEIFFGSINGINSFFPDKIKKDEYQPNVVVTDFKIFNATVTPGKSKALKESITVAKEIILDHNESYFSFEYAAMNFNSPKNISYAHMLEGYDENWIVTGNRSYADYAKVPPGDYIFRVKAANKDNVWSDKTASIRVEIIPPFWMTNLFRFIVFVILGLLIYVFYANKARANAKTKKELESKVASRTEELNKEIVERENAEEKYKALFEQAGDYILLLELIDDKGLVIVDANKAACKIHGYSRDEFLGKSISSLDKKLSEDQKQTKLEKILSGETFRFETAHSKKDGTIFPIEASTSLLRTYDERTLLISIERDITERKESRRSIERE